MNLSEGKETINCLYCNENQSIPWAHENGYTAVKCVRCGLVYVNPRPSKSLISEAVRTGVHRDVASGRTAVNRRVATKVRTYRKILKEMFNDVWANQRPITWVDVGAGYGEIIEAVSALSYNGSKIIGVEPMRPKVEYARKRGLNVIEAYLNELDEKFEFLSLVNVYSHIPDFRSFLNEIKRVLTDSGEVFIETGNIADLICPSEVPTELDLPDHLVFAGERHLIGFLENAGFSILYIRRKRRDGFINFLKNIVKRFLGRQVTLAIPYTSAYRTLLIRAKLLK